MIMRLHSWKATHTENTILYVCCCYKLVDKVRAGSLLQLLSGPVGLGS